MTKESIDAIFEDVSKLLLKKNQDYKGASFDLWLNGNMVHLWDKIRRYRSLVENLQSGGAEPNYEGIDDTLRDIIGYAVIGLHILKQSDNK